MRDITEQNYRLYRFDGETFSCVQDGERLGKQLERVYSVLRDIQGKWFTLRELSEITGDPESSVSSRLRDLRKEKFGGNVHQIESRRRYQSNLGLWEYRLVRFTPERKLWD